MENATDQFIRPAQAEPVEEEAKTVYEPSEATTLLEETKRATEELKRVIAENKETLSRMEKFRAEEILKGRSEAGLVVAKKEETAEQYARRVMMGGVK
jgi:hypothetical protein